MPNTTMLRLCILVALVVFAGACSSPQQPPMPIGNLKIGVAHYTQPVRTSDMLAGYLPENMTPIAEKYLTEMDMQFAEVLALQSKHQYSGKDSALHCYKELQQTTNFQKQSALRTWSAVGRCMNVDFLIVPQLLEWRDRDGGELGVVVPAKIVMDTFVVDVHNESLVSRSRYDETQTALTSNLLDAGKFFKRGGKWVETKELAKEGMEKAVKELGL